MDSPAIEVDALRKRYGRRWVLDGVDFHAVRGTVLALLGPNGAGKTTTVGILSTLLPSDGGTARVCGHDVSRSPAAVRRSLSLTGQYAAVDGFLTGRENLALMAGIAGLRGRGARTRVAQLLDDFELTDAAGRRVSTYSGGMRRRLDLAISLLPRPEVLVLDEPTTGLDPRSRTQVWRSIRELVGAGTTVLLTTQYLDEADALADDVVVLDRGAVIAHGSPEELKRRVDSDRVVVSLADHESLELARAAAPQASVDLESLTVAIATTDAAGTLRAFFDAAPGAAVADVRIDRPTLDDVFLTLTGREPESQEVAA
ncbi:ATP-binding cassette domain-containing protein [Gryllotalpicola protaetiae]|uniref:ATP-binding cassette domain-containing protein n=1 Tax=Gryllotalpicola protaetiae TaxID=2419771 RepID=A0A387BTR0_9MICO|nr:ATP-binding cassette domain-containing protein [Gryllotalpicola protaetiae]AYG04419.1 ATP-binding cassette domain-containing protein [Gryllotalpicola protaetiae]